MSNDPTQEFYDRLTEAAAHFNEKLFEGDLPPMIITVQRGLRTRGQFSPERWARKDGSKAHELAINPAHLASNTLLELFQTIVREQAHCWQHCFGTPSRRGYGNQEYRDKMREIGLQTSSTGKPGGKDIGQGLLDYPIIGGRFLSAAAELLEKQWNIPWVDRECRESAVESIAHWANPAATPVAAASVATKAENEPSYALTGDQPKDPNGDIVVDFRDDGPEDNDEPVGNSPFSESLSDTDSEADPLQFLAKSMPDTDINVIASLTGGRVADMLSKEAEINVKAPATKTTRPSKVKYSCECAKVWGKPGLSLRCNNCMSDFVQDTAQKGESNGSSNSSPEPDANAESTKAQVFTASTYNREGEAVSLEQALAEEKESDDFDNEDDEDAFKA